MTKVEKAVQWAVGIANDNRHGYSQLNRNGNPDYDCSSLTISAYEWAGVPVGKATYTGNMYSEFICHGWKDVTRQINLSNGFGLIKGDVLLNHECHTVIYIGEGKVVNARTDTDCRCGDSNGDEIRIQPYWNFPWNAVLRYTEESVESTSDNVSISDNVITVEIKKVFQNTLKQGSEGYLVTALQAILNYYGADLDMDSDFGRLTKEAVVEYQKKHKDKNGEPLEVDGIAGIRTWESF